MDWFPYVVSFCYGLILGSFFNVCIYRIPKKKSLGERSRCPSCGGLISWYDNIPLLSFIILRGKCRRCSSRISLRYPAVEATSGILFILIYWWGRNLVPSQFNEAAPKIFTPEMVLGLILVSVLVIVTVIDIREFIIPNVVIGPGILLSLVCVLTLSLLRGEPVRLAYALLGGLIGGGFLLLSGLTYGFLFLRRRTEVSKDIPGEDESGNDEMPTGIGFGDVKLTFFTGFVLGYFYWYLVVVQLFLGFLLGSIVSLFMILFLGKGRKDLVPFGPFLSCGAVIALIWGKQLVDLYLKLLR